MEDGIHLWPTSFFISNLSVKELPTQSRFVSKRGLILYHQGLPFIVWTYVVRDCLCKVNETAVDIFSCSLQCWIKTFKANMASLVSSAFRKPNCESSTWELHFAKILLWTTVVKILVNWLIKLVSRCYLEVFAFDFFGMSINVEYIQSPDITTGSGKSDNTGVGTRYQRNQRKWEIRYPRDRGS